MGGESTMGYCGNLKDENEFLLEFHVWDLAGELLRSGN